MARSRNIKPGFFTNDELAGIEPLGRLIFIGLWTIADREGRLEDRPKKIKVEILPYDDVNVDEMLNQLASKGFIVRYEIDGNKYIQIANFIKHQNPHHKEIPSVIPAPLGVQNKYSDTSPVNEETRARIFKRDNYQCVACSSTEDLSIDHKHPVSKGGSSTDDNLQTLCLPCNLRKGSMLQEQFMLKSSMNQACSNDKTCLPQEGQPNPADSLNLIPDSVNLIPDTIAIPGNSSVDKSVDNSKGVTGTEIPVSGEKDEVAETSTDFMIFWNEYPRREGMSNAVKAWNDLMKRGIPSNDVVRAAKKYSIKVKMERTVAEYVKMPHTFLSTGFFRDFAPVYSPDCPECRGEGWIPKDKTNPTGVMAECACKKRLDIA